MADTESDQTKPSRSRLPSPGCLFAVTLLVMLASVCFWIGCRAHRQQERIEYLEQFRSSILTVPAIPDWLYDPVEKVLGEENAAGFTDIAYIYAEDTESAEISDSFLQHLGDLTDLTELEIKSTRLTTSNVTTANTIEDAILQYPAKLAITDAGMQHLSGLENLRALSLANTQVTDAGLQHLSGLTNLEYVDLHNTNVTNVGVQQLRTRLPGAEITH